MIFSRVCGDKIQIFLTGSRDMSSCVCGDENRYLKLVEPTPDHKHIVTRI